MAFVAEFLPSLQGIAAARLQVFSACRAYGFGLTGQPTEKSEQRYNACEISGEYSDSNTWMRSGWLHLSRREWGWTSSTQRPTISRCSVLARGQEQRGWSQVPGHLLSLSCVGWHTFMLTVGKWQLLERKGTSPLNSRTDQQCGQRFIK